MSQPPDHPSDPAAPDPWGQSAAQPPASAPPDDQSTRVFNPQDYLKASQQPPESSASQPPPSYQPPPAYEPPVYQQPTSQQPPYQQPAYQQPSYQQQPPAFPPSPGYPGQQPGQPQWSPPPGPPSGQGSQGGPGGHGGYGGPPATRSPDGPYPVQLTIDYPEQQSRLLAALSIPFFLARLILIIPIFFCLYFIFIAAEIVAWIAMWAIAFTGHYPRGMHNFVVGALRWNVRATAYVFGLTDRYPPFRLDP